MNFSGPDMIIQPIVRIRYFNINRNSCSNFKQKNILIKICDYLNKPHRQPPLHPPPDLHNYENSSSGNFKILKKQYEITFFKRAQCFLAGIESTTRQSGGGILLGDSTGGGVVMLRSIEFQRAGVWISTGLPCNAHTYLTTYIINFDLHKI